MRNYKFTKLLNTKFKEFVTILERLKAYTSEATRLLKIIADKEDFLVSATEFSNLSHESLICIYELLEKGYFAQCEVSTRWYLELCYIYRYLWENPEEYKAWSSGKEIRPKDVGAYFQKRGLDTSKVTYKSLSNAVHCNDTFISYYGLRAADTPINEFQEYFLGNLLVHIIITSHRINYVSYKNLMPYMGIDSEILKERFELIDNTITRLVTSFNKKESAFINKILTNPQ